jgi:hypothetical protein
MIFKKLKQLLRDKELSVSKDKMALITLIYQSDNKYCLQEQDFISNFIEELPWPSGISKENFQSYIISKALSAIEISAEDEYLNTYCIGLKGNDEVIDIFDETASSDGEICDAEMKILNSITKILIKF